MNPQIPHRSSSATIQHLAVAWREAKGLLPLFPLLAKGEPLEIDRASEVTGVPALEPLVAELSISGSPQVERRPRDAEVPAGLVDVPHALGVLEDSPLPMNLSLLVGPTDLLGHTRL